MRSLDLGAQGILIPHCCTAEDARRFKQGSLYAPQGTRGVGPGRSKQWGVVGNEEYYQTINDQVLLLAMIEDPEAIDNIEAIAQEGLDVLWVGTGDLAASYGVPGQLTHPKVVEASQADFHCAIGCILDSAPCHTHRLYFDLACSNEPVLSS